MGHRHVLDVADEGYVVDVALLVDVALADRDRGCEHLPAGHTVEEQVSQQQAQDQLQRQGYGEENEGVP